MTLSVHTNSFILVIHYLQHTQSTQSNRSLQGGGVIDTVSQGIIDNIHKIYGNEFGVSLYVDTYLHYLHTEKKTMLLAYRMLKKRLEDNVCGCEDEINKVSRMILWVTARAFVTLPT
jgi:hypothetical protein